VARSADRQRHCDGCGTRLARDNRSGRCSPCSLQQVRASSAPTKPDEFWQRASLRDALGARHFGQVLYAYRHEHRPALTQAKIGRWLGLTQGQVSRLERGEQPTNDLDKARPLGARPAATRAIPVVPAVAAINRRIRSIRCCP